ncbi:MAG TPA: hypothetical protein VKV20_14495 [Ktedonobacteraceae bacterium]|nr:hypothetical protein [Ktedonobacteraceae bacterium]
MRAVLGRWLVCHFAIFANFGSEQYQLQPIFVEDIADLVVAAGQSNNNQLLDVVRPDLFTFEELVRLIASKLGNPTTRGQSRAAPFDPQQRCPPHRLPLRAGRAPVQQG